MLPSLLPPYAAPGALRRSGRYAGDSLARAAHLNTDQAMTTLTGRSLPSPRVQLGNERVDLPGQLRAGFEFQLLRGENMTCSARLVR
jgi:hypothetical protein